MMKQKITFHIGFEKTGTRSFQQFCAKNAKILQKYSVFYPLHSLAFGEQNHAPLVACYLDYEDLSIRSSGQSRLTVLRSLLTEIGEAESSNILISAEHFSSRFREREIHQLAADFSDFDCRIAMVVREHRARFFSAYDQSVRSGRDITLEAYCDEIFHPGHPYLRYAATIGGWEQAFGRENISLFGYAPEHDIVPVLCEALISPKLALQFGQSRWENRSIGPEATEWLRRVNGMIGRIPGTRNVTVRRALAAPRRGFVKLARKLNRDAPRWQLSERDARRLDEIAAADREWLRTRYGIQLPSSDQDANLSRA